MAATTDVEYKHYLNPVLGVSLDYPANWAFEESPSVGIILFAEEKTLKSQNLMPTSPVVNLIVQKIPGITLNDFSEQQLMRMKEMTGGEITVERTAKFGDVPAHKAVSSLSIPGGLSIKFFSLWAYANGVGYSFFFHAIASEFSKFGPYLTRMTKSFKAVKTMTLSYPLESFNNDNVVFRYPGTWKADIKSSSADSGDKSPLVTLTHTEMDGAQTISTTVRLLTTTKKGPLSTHIDLLKVQLEKMHVEEVELTTTKVGTKEARLASWTSDASGTPTRYMHLMTTENDEETTPVLALTMMTTAKKDEYDQMPGIFRQIRSSFVFLSDSEAARHMMKWGGYYHLKFNFGFLYDTGHYTYRAEGIPLTEASFSRIGDDPSNPLVNFSVIVRELDPAETPDLVAMGDELQENLKGVCGSSLQKVVSESATLCGLPGRVMIFHGSAASPANPSDIEEMYFAYKYVINKEARTALLFAFASTPQFWQNEWKLVEGYLESLYWSS